MGVAYNTSIVTNGLVLALDAANTKSYPGTGTTWTDLSGNSNTGTLTNGPTYNTSNNGFLTFDGINDYGLLTNPATLRNQDFTVSLWVYPQTQNQALTTLADFEHDNSGLQGWVIQSEDSTTNRYYYLAYYTGSAFQPVGLFGVGKGVQITNNAWQNLTFTKSGTSIVGYLNGIQTYSATAGSSTISYVTSKNFAISNTVNQAYPRYFKGNVATCQIYSRALSSSEIVQNFNALRGRYGL
jgi:hypothetical protein